MKEFHVKPDEVFLRIFNEICKQTETPQLSQELKDFIIEQARINNSIINQKSKNNDNNDNNNNNNNNNKRNKSHNLNKNIKLIKKTTSIIKKKNNNEISSKKSIVMI